MYGVIGGNVGVTKFLTMSGADLTITDNVSIDNDLRRYIYSNQVSTLRQCSKCSLKGLKWRLYFPEWGNCAGHN